MLISHLEKGYVHYKAVKHLMVLGANVNITNYNGNSPLQLMAVKGNVKVAKLLIKYGAVIDFRNGRGETALCLAVWHIEVTALRYK